MILQVFQNLPHREVFFIGYNFETLLSAGNYYYGKQRSLIKTEFLL